MKIMRMAKNISLTNYVVLWKVLALALILQSMIFQAMTQSADEVLLVLIVWWGAYLALDLLPYTNHLRPSPLGAGLGFLLVLWVLWRSVLISGANLGSTLLPLLAGLGLALLATPLRGLRRFLPAIGILALLPLMRALLIPYPTLITKATAYLAKFFLLLCGLPVLVQDNLVRLPGGNVVVASQCTGLPAMLQLLTVSLIFAIVFPMRFRWQNVLMSLCAIVLGFLINGLRIALLAIINASTHPSRQWLFDNLHNGWPAWIFPGIAALLFVNIYTLWLEHQVDQLEGQ